MKRIVFSCLAVLFALAASVLFLWGFPQGNMTLYGVAVVLYALSAGLITILYVKKKPLLFGIVAAVVYAGIYCLITYLINNVAFHGNKATIASVVISSVNLLFFILYFVFLSHGKLRQRLLAACAFVLSALPVVSFALAILVPFSGGVKSVVGSTEATPIVATKREYVFDRDRLMLGAYCFTKGDNYGTLRQWFKEAGLDFYIGAWGEELTEDDFSWLAENDLGVFLPNTEKYRAVDSDADWGIDLRDEPSAADFEKLAESVKELYTESADRFPLINLFPMYASGDQLGEHATGPHFDGFRIDAVNTESIQYRMHLSDYIGSIDSDIISVDIYPLEVDQPTGRLETYDNWLRNLDILADACRETGRDLWVITQAAGTEGEGGGKRYCDTVEDQRWQNYVSLAFGTKAIIYACYYTGWWDSASHMIDNDGKRTETYYAVQQANAEMAAFSEEYGKYENHGAVLYNGVKAAGAKLGLVKVDDKYKPEVKTSDPVLCGCFTEKNGNDKAFVFTNMYEPQGGKEASFSTAFSGAKSITVYRKGKSTHIAGDKLDMTLESREGVFVTVEY